eukprot:3073167-Pyramimonas_sp.AAC.1
MYSAVLPHVATRAWGAPSHSAFPQDFAPQRLQLHVATLPEAFARIRGFLRTCALTPPRSVGRVDGRAGRSLLGHGPVPGWGGLVHVGAGMLLKGFVALVGRNVEPSVGQLLGALAKLRCAVRLARLSARTAQTGTVPVRAFGNPTPCGIRGQAFRSLRSGLGVRRNCGTPRRLPAAPISPRKPPPWLCTISTDMIGVAPSSIHLCHRVRRLGPVHCAYRSVLQVLPVTLAESRLDAKLAGTSVSA